MESKFDEKLSKMLNEEINIPQKVTNRIRSSLEEKRKGVYWGMKLNKIVVTMAVIMLMATGVVFASQIIIANRNSVNVAKESGYFENVEMDYVYDKGIGIKAENYFIDQGRAGITIDIKTEEEIDYAQIYSTSLTGDGSYVEEIDGKVYVRCNDRKVEKEYSRRFDIIRFIDKNGEETCIDGREPDIMGTYEKLGNNTIRRLYQTRLYPEGITNKMKVMIKRIATYKDGNKKEYIGNWEFEINIADKYLDSSNVIEYQGTVNLKNVEVKKATLTATELIVILKADDVCKLVNYTEGNPVSGQSRLYGEEEKYDYGELDTSRDYDYDKNEIVLRFDISKFYAENNYKIILDGGMAITLTKK